VYKSSFALITGAALLILSCASSPPPPTTFPLRIRDTEAPKIRASGATVERELEPAPPAPGVLRDIEMAGDTPIVVAHAEDGVDRLMIYLHGACGDIHSPKAWSDVSAKYATLVAIRGDRRCDPTSERTYWSDATERHQARIEAAIAEVEAAGKIHFAPENVILMGYSQNAQIAEELVRAYPDRYPRVILGGIPVPPSASHLANVRAVAVLGGERELVMHMRVGMWALTAKHIPARFALFPKARHGEFGPDGARVMDETLEWLTQK